ncbi:MAG: hypothetical protein AAFU56_09685, partial [Pseudomonadota bacterium]
LAMRLGCAPRRLSASEKSSKYLGISPVFPAGALADPRNRAALGGRVGGQAGAWPGGCVGRRMRGREGEVGALARTV